MIEDRSSVLTAALAGVCGGLLAQAVVTELGAMVDGPAVTADWREERLQVVAPSIGNRHSRPSTRAGTIPTCVACSIRSVSAVG